MTPYARIQGSGDGSFDLFSFKVTPDMLSPQALTSQTAQNATADPNAFFTSADLRLTGRVTADDVWKLGIRYRDYSYKAEEGDDARGRRRRADRGDRARRRTATRSRATHDVLRIEDQWGFNLQGLEVMGAAHDAFGAAIVTRNQTARDRDGTVLEFAQGTVHARRHRGGRRDVEPDGRREALRPHRHGDGPRPDRARRSRSSSTTRPTTTARPPRRAARRSRSTARRRSSSRSPPPASARRAPRCSAARRARPSRARRSTGPSWSSAWPRRSARASATRSS